MKKNYRPGEPRTPAEKRRRELMTPIRSGRNLPRGEHRPIPLTRKVDGDEIVALLDRLYGKEQFI